MLKKRKRYEERSFIFPLSRVIIGTMGMVIVDLGVGESFLVLLSVLPKGVRLFNVYKKKSA